MNNIVTMEEIITIGEMDNLCDECIHRKTIYSKRYTDNSTSETSWCELKECNFTEIFKPIEFIEREEMEL